MHRTLQRMTGGDTLVLCVHGIQGSPSQFEWLTALLPGHIDYLCLLLPGHGGSVRNFARAGSGDWLGFIRSAASDLSARYRRIIFVGHSMGCLLGLLAAAGGCIKPHGMLLLACPLSLRPTLRYVLNSVKAITQRSPADPWVQAAKEANSVKTGSPLAYLICAKPYIGLFRLMRMARKSLRPMNLPLVALHSDRDEIVGRKSLAILHQSACAQTDLVPDSGHFLYSDRAKEMIGRRLLALTEHP